MEKDYPTKDPDSESKKRKATTSNNAPNKKSTFDRGDYIGEGAKKAGKRGGGGRGGRAGGGYQSPGSDDERPKGSLGLFSLGYEKKIANKEPSSLKSIGLGDIFLASGEVADAPDTPTFSATKAPDAFKQMVYSCLASEPGSKKRKKTAKDDKKEFQFARRHFHRNNKP